MKSKIILSFIFVIIFSTHIYSQDKVGPYSKTVSFFSNGNGFNGNITIQYGFMICAGSIVAPVSWKNLNIESVNYEGKKYFASDLGLNSFKDYVIGVSKIDAKFNSNNVGYIIGTGYSNYVQNNFSMGCLGEYIKTDISEEYNNKLSSIDGSFDVKISMSGDLSWIIQNFLKEKENRKIFKEKISDYKYASSNKEKLEILNSARKYAKSSAEISELEEYINKVNSELEKDRKDELTKIEKERQKKIAELEIESETEKIELAKQQTLAETNQQSKNSEKNERQISNEKVAKSRKNLYDSENTLLNQANNMREEANTMVVEYKFQQEYKDKLLKDAEELESRVVKNRNNRRVVLTGTDENDKRSAAVTSFNERMSTANEANAQMAAESAAAAVGIVYLLGGVIYDDYGYNDGSIYKTGTTNFHFGADFGFSLTSAPVFFPSEERKIDPNTQEEYVDEFNEPGQPVAINLGSKVQLGVESNFYKAEIYGGFRAGISPILSGTHTQIFYGAQVSVGVKNIKLLAGYELGHRNYTLTNSLSKEEEGKGNSKVGTKNLRVGLEISWYGDDSAFARNHISFGLMQEQVIKLGSDNFIESLPEGDFIINGITFNDEGQAGYYLDSPFLDSLNKLDDYKFKGAFLEWRHDHHGTLLIEAFPNYPHTGITKPFFDPDDWSKKGNFLLTISFTRNLDWFFN